MVGCFSSRVFQESDLDNKELVDACTEFFFQNALINYEFNLTENGEGHTREISHNVFS